MVSDHVAAAEFSIRGNSSANWPIIGRVSPGQILSAVTLNGSHQGFVNLRIGTQSILASTSVPLEENTQLLLKVIQSHPQVVLKLHGLHGASSNLNPMAEAKLNFLPIQSSLNSLLSAVTRESAPKGDLTNFTDRSLPLSSLVHAIPSRASIEQGNGLRQAVLQSGVFLEALLATSGKKRRIDLSSDLKANLLSLLQRIQQLSMDSISNEYLRLPADLNWLGTGVQQDRNMLPEKRRRILPDQKPEAFSLKNGKPSLAEEILGSLARLVMQQISTVENFNEGKALWQLNVPIREGNVLDTISISIEKEHNNSRNPQSNVWVVNLDLDLSRLGPLLIRISLFETGISAVFWSESVETLSLIDSKLEKLNQNLTKHGLKTISIGCLSGKPPLGKSPTVHQPLFDIHV